jgi:hypothetical protein
MRSVKSRNRLAWLSRSPSRADHGLSELRIRPGKQGQPTGRSLSSALTDVLSQRVKVTFTETPRWMSGYDAIVLVLRDRALGGDATACQVLADLMKFAGMAGAASSEGTALAAPPTSPEEELDEAFAERARQRSHPEDDLAGRQLIAEKGGVAS